jgi:hypothetical protein
MYRGDLSVSLAVATVFFKGTGGDLRQEPFPRFAESGARQIERLSRPSWC